MAVEGERTTDRPEDRRDRVTDGQEAPGQSKEPMSVRSDFSPERGSGEKEYGGHRETVSSETRARLAVAGVIAAAAITYVSASNFEPHFLVLFAVPALLFLAAATGGSLASVLTPLADKLTLGANIDRDLEEALEPIRRERNDLEAEAEDQHGDVISSIRLNVNRIQEYYTVNLAQARGSFRLSVFALVSGLVVILVGVGLLYVDVGGVEVSVLATAAGLVAEFIGGAYFYVYKRSLAQVNYFYKNLLRLQETALAVSLCERLDGSRRDDARLRMIEILLTRESLAAPELPNEPDK